MQVRADLSVVFMLSLIAVAPAGAGTPSSSECERLRDQALEAMRVGFITKDNPAVRVAAIEAMEASGLPRVLPWLRLALDDPAPPVRFAALLALGRLEDAGSRSEIESRLQDDNPNVRLASLFALHRLGDDRRTGKLASYLLNHEEAAVRRNAALVFGFMRSEGAIKMLARAMSDRDMGVRHYALEGLVRLGNPEARQELMFMTNSGVGSEEVFAVLALGTTKDRQYLDTYRYKLNNGVHTETRLAAAHALGLIGSAEGFDLSMRSLANPDVRQNDGMDPIPDQVARIRIMAATALGSIGKPEALNALVKAMEDGNDPRLAQAAARAVMEIIAPLHHEGFPFRARTESSGSPGGR